MLTANKHLPAGRGLAPALRARAATLSLDWDTRSKSRFDAHDSTGRHIAVFLPRGTVLRHGDRLRTTNGLLVEVRAAAETVSTARGSDPLLLARAAYHLGNRHVALQIGPGWLRYLHDHVLDDMVRELGLELCCEQAPFEPEAGAYGGAQGAHHDHAH